MREKLKKIFFPTPPGLTEEENDQLIAAFLRFAVFVLLVPAFMGLSSWLSTVWQ